MPARRLDGAAVAAAVRAELGPRIAEYRARAGRPPALDIVLVGDDPGSQIYVRNKERAGGESGLHVTVHRLPPTTSLDDLLSLIRRLNESPGSDGILVQSPLPAAMGKGAAQRVFDAIDPAKDVDGFHPHNVGLLVQGRATLAPCTPSGIIELLSREAIPLAGRRAVVIGRSEIVGKPLALLLLQRDATVTVCHSKTTDLEAVARTADVLVAAIGRPAFVTPLFVKPGATVVDVGTSRVADRAQVAAWFGQDSQRLADFDKKGSTVVGDVHPSVAETAGALTPVPGGVGPLTIAMLLRHACEPVPRSWMRGRFCSLSNAAVSLSDVVMGAGGFVWSTRCPDARQGRHGLCWRAVHRWFALRYWRRSRIKKASVTRERAVRRGPIDDPDCRSRLKIADYRLPLSLFQILPPESSSPPPTRRVDDVVGALRLLVDRHLAVDAPLGVRFGQATSLDQALELLVGPAGRDDHPIEVTLVAGLEQERDVGDRDLDRAAGTGEAFEPAADGGVDRRVDDRLEVAPRRRI